MPDGDGPAPLYSVLMQGRLAAKIRAGAGAIRRAGRKAADGQEPLAFADIEIFDVAHESLVRSLARDAEGVDQLLFRLKLEGFDVREGELRIAGTGARRF